MSEPTTLNEMLVRAAGFPEAGLRFLDRRERPTWRSWGDLCGEGRAAATALRGLDVAPGERVALIYPTGPEFFQAFFGILLAGAVPVPLYPPIRLGRLDEYHRRTATMLRAAGARLVLAESRLRRLLGPTMAEARPQLGCRTLGEVVDKTPDGRATAAAYTPAGVTPSDLALVQFSSGTTVDPKPVALSHRAVVAQTTILNRFWPETGGVPDSGVSWLPLYHDMGLIGCIFPALERPGVMTLIGPEVFVARPAVWLRTLSRYRATISVAPNFAYGLCVDKIRDDELDGVDLSAWRVALNGAEPIAPSVLRTFQRRFARWGFRPGALTPVYGLSEASLAVTFSSLADEFRSLRIDRERLAGAGRAVVDSEGHELVSVGRPIPGFEVEVVGPEGRVPEDVVGRVRVRGPSLMDAYLGRPEATAAVLRDGWLDTGDLGFLHGGELYLTGRAKDVVILRGRNYLPSDIEQAVGEVSGVRRGCVVAASHLPEGGAGERLLLFVERVRGFGDDPALLRRACVEGVLGATGLKVDEVVVVEPGTLPRTSSGKLRRGETLRRHLAGELSAPRRVTPWLLAGAMARSVLAYAGLRKKP